MTSVIEVQHLDKHFRLQNARKTSLKERLIHPRGGGHTDLHVLQDVTFEVGAGETIGVLGRNGSGKSTLLKCICGVLKPTAGEITLRGSLAGLLELGAGFAPELSGRDNIYLSASLLGLSKKSVDRLFDDIVEFAELETFIDTPVKFYSSGMYVRLGFSVATSVNPEILVVDEVLAVGDERFQAKCMDRIRRFQADGRTILLVSHNADQVRALCDRTIVLDRGQMVANTSAGEGVRVFRERLLGEVSHLASATPGEHVATIESISTPTGSFTVHTNEDFTFDLVVQANQALEGRFIVELHTRSGELITRSEPGAAPVTLEPGVHTLSVTLPRLPLLDGSFELSVGIVSPEGNSVLAWREQIAVMEVVYPGRGAGLIALRPTLQRR